MGKGKWLKNIYQILTECKSNKNDGLTYKHERQTYMRLSLKY